MLHSWCWFNQRFICTCIKRKGFAKNIIGVSRTEASLDKAKELGIIDEALPLEEAVKKSDFIYVAIPVDATIPVMKQIMDLINDKQIVADAGSTKYALCEALTNHPKRKRFVATHPMWGTEYSGPEAAVRGAFKARACVICEKEKSDADAVKYCRKYLQNIRDAYYLYGC